MNKQTQTIGKPSALVGIIISLAVTSCASQKTAQNPNDPWEGRNRSTHTFNTKVDKTILQPMAKGYQKVAPTPVDQGVTNFFSNINDIGVSVNELLQLKFLQSGMDVSRFVINSTIGVAGIFDVASKLKLPKHNEDFGQTLGFWGVPSGNYTVLPFLGSSSPRDAVGLLGDALLNPLTYVSLFGGIGANAATSASTALDITDTRSDLMSTEKIVDEGAVDRYDFLKNAYLQHREYLIHDGNPPESNDDPLADESSTPNPMPASGDMPAVTVGGNTLNHPANTGPAEIINNSKTLPPPDNAPVPIINNSKRFLELSAPDPE